MDKKCSKCGAVFQCMHREIEKCHCDSVHLSKELMEYLSKQYKDCLCYECLAKLVDDFKLL